MQKMTTIVATLALLLGGCGGDDVDADTTVLKPSTSTQTTPSTTIPQETDPANLSNTCPKTTDPKPSSSDWASYGFDDANTRHNRAETTISPANVSCLEVLWRIDDLGGVTGTPVVVDGVVYFGDWNGSLHAVDAETGSAIWEDQLSDHPITAAAVVTDRFVYVPDVGGLLHARDRLTGAAVWSVDVDDQPDATVLAAPVLVDGKLIVGVAGNSPFAVDLRGSVVAFDADDGSELWRLSTADEDFGPGAGVWAQAAVDPDLGMVFLGTGNAFAAPASPLSNAIIAIDYETGSLAWHNQLTPDDLRNLDVGSSPNLFTVDGREVVGVGGKEGWFTVVDRGTGEDVWSVRLTGGGDPGGVMTTAALGDALIYVNAIPAGSGSSITFALDMHDGSVVWEQPLPQIAFGALALANGVLYQGTIDGTIYALDAVDGSVLWADQLEGGFGDGISVADGKLFVGHGFQYSFAPTQSGGLVAYGLP